MADRSAVVSMAEVLWGGSEMVVHDEVICPADLPGFVAESSAEIVGLVTNRVVAGRWEIVGRDSLLPWQRHRNDVDEPRSNGGGDGVGCS